jgi:hypothetical protein
MRNIFFFFYQCRVLDRRTMARTPTNTNTVLCKIGHAMPSCIKHQVYTVQGLSISGLAGAIVQESQALFIPLFRLPLIAIQVHFLVWSYSIQILGYPLFTRSPLRQRASGGIQWKRSTLFCCRLTWDHSLS